MHILVISSFPTLIKANIYNDPIAIKLTIHLFHISDCVFCKIIIKLYRPSIIVIVLVHTLYNFVYVSMLTESPSGMLPRKNLMAMVNGLYKTLGIMLSTIIVQGGQPPSIFAPCVVRYIQAECTVSDALMDSCHPVDVPDARIRASMEQVDCSYINDT
jgi:hypothetical protein